MKNKLRIPMVYMLVWILGLSCLLPVEAEATELSSSPLSINTTPIYSSQQITINSAADAVALDTGPLRI